MESCNIHFSVTGTYKDGLSPAGYVLSDHMLLGSVVATILVIVVTAQVSFQIVCTVFAFLCVIHRVWSFVKACILH